MAVLSLLLVLIGLQSSTATATQSLRRTKDSGTTNNNSITSINEDVQQQQRQQQSLPQSSHAQHDNHRMLEVYALYSLPIVEVTLMTVWTEALEQALQLATTDVDQDDNNRNGMILLSQTSAKDSSLSFPFRTATQEYLYEGFQTLISEWERSLPYSNGDVEEVHTTAIAGEEDDFGASLPGPSFTFYNMYNHLVTVDMHVKLFLSTGSIGNMGTMKIGTTPVTLLAELHTTLAFLEPSGNTAAKPSNDDVTQLFGYTWMIDTLLQDDNLEYQAALTTSSTNYPLWMQRITSVEALLAAQHSNTPAFDTSTGWSKRTETAMLTLMILLILGGVGCTFLAYHRHRRKTFHAQMRALHHGERYDLDNGQDGYQDEYYHNSPSATSGVRKAALSRSLSHDDRSFVSGASSIKRPPPLTSRVSSLDAARHGADVFHRTSTQNAMTALEASDRYLSKHRPDLYEGSSAAGNASTATGTSWFGRSYEIPSNPLDLIGGYFFSQSVQQNEQAAAAHFPFSPSAFATPTTNDGSGHRRSSFTNPSPSPSASSAFTPISASRNLAATAHDTHHANPEEYNGATSTSAGAHTGQSWGIEDHSSNHSSTSIGNIFRNLSMSAWMGGGSSSHHSNNNNNHNDDSRYYDDNEDNLDFHHANDPSLEINGDIELEDLPADYDFPFQDFPRVDGTPCLIYNEDALVERERQKIFAPSPPPPGADEYESGTEKKEDDAARGGLGGQRRSSVSDAAFRRMLSDHPLDVDDDLNDDMLADHRDADDNNSTAKSPQFQKQLSRLMETKQRRYAMEHKKEAIVQKQRQKRQNVREKQRLERHKAMERDLEEIEAEFLSPLTRAKQQQQQMAPPVSPKGDGSSAAYLSPGRKVPNQSPLSKFVARSPILQRFSGSHRKHNSIGSSPFRRRGSGQHANTAGAVPSPREAGHSRSKSGTGLPRVSSYHQDGSSSTSSLPPSVMMAADTSSTEGLDVSHEYQFKDRFDLFGQQRQQNGVDLSLPTMLGHGHPLSKDGVVVDTKKYPSPQSVVDEAMQSSVAAAAKGTSVRHYSHTYSHRPTRTPSRPTAASLFAGGGSSQHRRINSLDVAAANNAFAITIDGGVPFVRSPLKRSNSQHRRSGSSASVGGGGGGGTISPTGSGKERYSRSRLSNSQHSLGGRRHRRSNSQSSQHRRSNSSQKPEEDLFLHGVVASTRFV